VTRGPGPLAAVLLLAAAATASSDRAAPVEVGSSRQLFLDDSWLESRQEVRLALHPPVPRKVAIASDRP
jgi:hypothetical protein